MAASSDARMSPQVIQSGNTDGSFKDWLSPGPPGMSATPTKLIMRRTVPAERFSRPRVSSIASRVSAMAVCRAAIVQSAPCAAPTT